MKKGFWGSWVLHLVIEALKNSVLSAIASAVDTEFVLRPE